MEVNDKKIYNVDNEKYTNLKKVMSDLDIYNAKELFLLQSLSVKEKSFILKLISKVKQIAKLNRNLEILEKISSEIYKSIGINDDIEKIEFEISRISKKLSGNLHNKDYYIKELNILRLLVDTYKKDNNVVDINDLYDSIIELEIELGLSIGLYDKLMNYFINKYQFYQKNKINYFVYDENLLTLEEEIKIKNKRK